ncbi:MAG: arginine decarboxylase [Acidobacteria bacterium]|nr:MAG: arginine decarboxylase [Acidobacteriota bacterium]
MNDIVKRPETEWNSLSAIDFYKIERWGAGYFSVNDEGNLCVCLPEDPTIKVDLKLVVDEMRKRKIEPPFIIRVMNILEDRIVKLATCFQEAIESCQYQGRYLPLFPVKVNQQKQVIESIKEYGHSYGMGLEVGSKAELIAALAYTSRPEALLVCNGYKDMEFAEIVGMAHKMGKKIIPVIEKYSEIETFLLHHSHTGIMPEIGVRLKLSVRGMGQWANSGGDRSKFGLRIPEIMQLVKRLKEKGLLSKLKLLHFHMGSQITQINAVKQALTEAGRVYGELVALGAEMEFLDVGGGLGVDYDGSTHNTFTTINYTIQEYANDVIYRIKQVCDQFHVEHPVILSESGRFLSAHYSFIIANIATFGRLQNREPIQQPKDDEPGLMKELYEIYEFIKKDGTQFLENYHDAVQARTEVVNLFNLGYLTMEQRARCERIFWAIMMLVQRQLDQMKSVPVELEDLELNLTDTYFANFSLFQSLPDAWAINQIFPLIPIHRLKEKPSRRGVVVDLTCDSDGCIKEYIGSTQNRPFVWLHPEKQGEPYYIGIFLVGAYQETLGELHNLFGETNAVQLDLLGNNKYQVSSFEKGDSVKDVLKDVGYSSASLLNRMRSQVEHAVQTGCLSLEDSAVVMDQYEKVLKGYTYFKPISDC